MSQNHPAVDTLSFSVLTGALAGLDVEMLFVPVFEQDDLSDVTEFRAVAGEEIDRVVSAREFTGELYQFFQLTSTSETWGAERVLLVGAGRREDFLHDRARKVASAVGLMARRRHVTNVGIRCRGELSPEELAHVTAEGFVLAGFNVDRYKSTDRNSDQLSTAKIIIPGGDVTALNVSAERGRVMGECCNLARGLANEPGNILTPRVLADRAVEIVEEAGVAVEVLEEDRLAELSMGLLLGVARGSAEPPRMVAMRHEPEGAPKTPVLGLIGKGITFDTGGISIKPAGGMDRMKDDMSGGAAVIGAMRAIGLLGAPIRVVGVVPIAENMPGSRATRPGDVLRGAGGQTVEVTNTDAEGRLVLGDGLWYAQQLGATHLVDVATLTGACVIALGNSTTGLFGAPEPWVSAIRHVADRAGDRCWQMPVFSDYFDQMKSEIADMVNTGGRPASSITAALFISQFAAGLPWAHFDIAGTAWNEEAQPYLPKGPSGVCVRALTELAFASDEWSQV